MPSWKKMLPKARKCVTASARARISVTKARKVINKEKDDSFLGNKETVSTLPTVTQPSTSSYNCDAIMTMLCEIRDSNANLPRRLDKVERRNSTPLNPRSQSIGQPSSPQLGPSHLLQQVDMASQLRDPLTVPGKDNHNHIYILLSHSFLNSRLQEVSST